MELLKPLVMESEVGCWWTSSVWFFFPFFQL